jgi:rare lipoprotein A
MAPIPGPPFAYHGIKGGLFILLCATGLITAFSFISCAPSITMSRESGSFGPREGMASYYGREFNGRKTASGERFDMHKFTAAHRELPFGTMVKVTNLANGKTVVVRVNDRGPFKRDRIIDLSLAAGKAIEMMGTGTARVKIEIVK